MIKNLIICGKGSLRAFAKTAENELWRYEKEKIKIIGYIPVDKGFDETTIITKKSTKLSKEL